MLAIQRRVFRVVRLVTLAAILLIACTEAPTSTPASEPAPGITATASSRPSDTIAPPEQVLVPDPTMAPTAGPQPIATPETMETPIGLPWWPSRWGADDEAGASNWITPDKVMEAVQLIETGTIYELGRLYEAGMPPVRPTGLLPANSGKPYRGPFGENKLIYHDEFLATEIGQVGTQFDGLGHVGVQIGEPGDLKEMRYYNGMTGAEIAGANGLMKLGVEKLRPLFTRGILINVAGLKGEMPERRSPWPMSRERWRNRECLRTPSIQGMPCYSTPAGGASGTWTTSATTEAHQASAWKSPVGLSRRKYPWSELTPGR